MDLHQLVGDAQEILRALGLPAAQTNERSALTLLALVNLTPGSRWSDAQQPLIGITPMMDFMATHYGKVYAPNSRETIRRQTVHQFIAAGVCRPNPDDTARPTNSGRTVYQVPAPTLALLRTFGTPQWAQRLEAYRRDVRSLVSRWAAEREMARIPVKLPDGRELTLSAGGQNVLIKAVLDEFCSRFAPGGLVLYVGDAAGKMAVCDRTALGGLGITVVEHGKMPDLIVFRPDTGWLIVIEAAQSHGPVDAKRHAELVEVFVGATAPLVFVTALPSRTSLRAFVTNIAWETEVWVADSPTHLIHFDGDRFLGPP